METEVTVRYGMSNHSFPWTKLDIKPSSRGSSTNSSVLSKQFGLPIYSHNYGLSTAMVCVSAKIHNRRRGFRQDDGTSAFVKSSETSNAQFLPAEYLRTVNEALTSYQSPSSSGRSSPTVTDHETESTASSAQIGWTGNTTERSSTDSTYSWDEFDKQAAKQVQSFFEQIDSVLFEQNTDGPTYIKKECQEWQFQFPHLRILGHQLMIPQELGYHVIHTDSSRPSTGSMGITDVTDHDISGTPDLQGLSLTGRSIEAKSVPIEARSVLSGREDSSLTSEFTHLEEEIIEQEGYYEEVIAIDYKDIYDESSEQKKQLTPRRHRVGYPPITPNACVKDSVLSSVFDSVWQEIIAWTRNLSKKYSVLVLEESKPLTIPMQPSSPQNRHEHSMLSREPSFSQAMYRQRSYTAAGALNLDNVLLISSKKISMREPSNLQDYAETPVPGTTRPASSFPTSATVRRPHSNTKFVRPAAQKPTRLAPIQSDATKSYTEERVGPNGALQVIKIAHARNGALPPLNTEVEPSKGQRGNSRASSAVVKDSLASHRERLGMMTDARPSTTHAMRSDTPQGNFNSRRASTPFGPVLNAIPSRSAIGGGGMVLVGSGLQPSSEHPLPSEILEDQESIEDVPYNKWTPSPPSHHNPYYRGRLKHYPLGVRP
ncbi:protein FAM149B1-like isoform X2 [Mytilus galloprovincialis]|uniref:protein FAM149B1-like isoform X2 n=1 Tax=Mytilus galloprovincialis TaxID=29158 RepID=UPI003F7C3AAD